MSGIDPWINQYENDQITEEAYSKYENHLLSVRAKFQKIIECYSYQHPTYLERYQKIIEMIDWTLNRYRMVLPIEYN